MIFSKTKNTILIISIVLIANACNKEQIDKPLTVTDIDKNVYNTVQIGEQIWMIENLKVTKYKNGEDIPNVTNDSTWLHTWTGAYCNYEHFDNNGEIYGRLYNWFVISDSRGICPDGWHVPTKEEWEILIDYLGGREIAGGKMKEIGTDHWISPNTGATNESGFTGLPGGGWFLSFDAIGEGGYWWTSTDWSDIGTYGWWLSYKNTLTSSTGRDKRMGFSIRCIKDK